MAIRSSNRRRKINAKIGYPSAILAQNTAIPRFIPPFPPMRMRELRGTPIIMRIHLF